MRLPRGLARFNRYVTNPVQRLWAGRIPGFAIIEHIGRRSGRTYRTPVNAYPVEGGFALLLMYGPDRDWLKNLNAAGCGRIEYRGRTFAVSAEEPVPASSADFLPALPATIARRLHVEYALLLTTH
jgi:deazaflavin-dependent oxidoreductase (nitroreductase family)